jgi:HK97 family phage prohead protease
MHKNLLSLDEFRAAAKDGGQPDGMVYRLAANESEAVGDAAARTRRFIFSDDTVDLSGDSIAPKGWVLDDFERNSVALWSHMSWDPPIGRASDVKVQKGKLVGDIEFATAEVYPFADTIYRLVEGGFLKAVSVGFKPLEWTFTQDKDRPYGIDFKRQTLLEISVCCVPCNPNALEEARAKGINTLPLVEWAEKVLDTGGSIMVPKSELESLRANASPQGLKHYYVVSDEVLTPPASKHLQKTVDSWFKSGGVLVLDKGFTLKSLDEPPAVASADAGPTEACANSADMQCAFEEPATCKTHSPEIKSGIGKAGRRISAKNKALLEAALVHHESASKCIRDVLEAEKEIAEEDVDEDDDGEDDDDETSSPEDDLDPAQRRLQEARALKASLTT